MKKLTVFVLILSVLFVFGCNAQRKPGQENQEPRLVPQESTIGFSQVDIEQVPASIRKVAATMENTPMVTWAHDNNNSYILLNTGKDEKTVKVSEVVQRVPVQDFVWLDVELNYTDNAKDGDANPGLVVVKLENADKAIDGVGFELLEEEGKSPEEEKEQAAPTPAPTPTPTPAPTVREPANQTRPAPVRETRPEEKQPQNQAPEEKERETGEQQQPAPAPQNGN